MNQHKVKRKDNTYLQMFFFSFLEILNKMLLSEKNQIGIK